MLALICRSCVQGVAGWHSSGSAWAGRVWAWDGWIVTDLYSGRPAAVVGHGLQVSQSPISRRFSASAHGRRGKVGSDRIKKSPPLCKGEGRDLEDPDEIVGALLLSPTRLQPVAVHHLHDFSQAFGVSLTGSVFGGAAAVLCVVLPQACFSAWRGVLPGVGSPPGWWSMPQSSHWARNDLTQRVLHFVATNVGIHPGFQQGKKRSTRVPGINSHEAAPKFNTC